MKSSPILILSCAANILAAIYLFLQPRADALVESTIAPFATTQREPSAPQTIQLSSPHVAAVPALPSGSSAIIDVLRRSGVSPQVIVQAAWSVVSARYEAERAEISRSDAKYAWQRIGSTRLTPEQRDKLDVIDAKIRAEVEALAGSEVAAATLESMKRSEAFQGLTDEQKLAVAKIRSDNGRILNEAVRRSPGDMLAAQAMVEAATDADLKAVLTPAQHQQYALYESQASRQLAQALSGADIDDAKFIEVVGAVHGISQADRPRVVAEVAGASVAVQYLKNVDKSYGQAIAPLQSAGMSDEAILRSRTAYMSRFAKRENNAVVDVAAIYDQVVAEMTPAQLQAFISSPAGGEMKRSVDTIKRLNEQYSAAP